MFALRISMANDNDDGKVQANRGILYLALKASTRKIQKWT